MPSALRDATYSTHLTHLTHLAYPTYPTYRDLPDLPRPTLCEPPDLSLFEDE
jgi:hypothetical protein